MNYRNFSQLNDAILRNLYKIPFDIDLVVGIPRSGIIPADLIALYRNVPYVGLNEFVDGTFFSGGERLDNYDINSIKKVLIVDDSLYSGEALKRCKQKLAKLKYEFQYIYLVVYVTPENKNMLDIYLEELPSPRVFQWNIMHHFYITQACVDIDGVLCVDPTEAENDDGPLYRNFLLTAKPLFLPTVKINTIVSCRLEKYRSETEVWLANHNIQYDNLILLDLPNKEARMKWGKYGEYKAEVYKKSNCVLFLESSLSQARIIAQRTHKAVFCIENFDMIAIKKSGYIKKIKRLIKRIIQY